MTGQEELLILRALVGKQKEELAAKDEIIAKQNIRIENMVQALLQARKKLFGSSTETSKNLDGQLSLFEKTQELAKELFSEQQKITVPSHTRKARQPGVRQEMLAGLPKEIEEYIIPPDENCFKCGGELKVIGKRIVRTEVTYEPPKLKVKQIIQQIAKCTQCGKAGSENPKDHLQKAAVPVPVLPHSIATPSLVAQVMYQKFAMGMPFARQEKDWYRLGLILSRSNMANWTNRCSEEWLTPVYERIHTELRTCEVLHMDETRIQCHREEGRKANSESYMWVIRSAACENIQAVFFHYSPRRKGEIARQLLSGFDGYLTTDAYSAYEKVENIRRNLCWSHCRRYYIDSIPLTSNGKEIPGSKGAEGRAYIDLLFKVENEIKDLSYEEIREKRLERSRPILDAFWSWVDETAAIPTTNEKLTAALNYSRNQKKYLETFLEDGRLPISNNLCEASIRPFATGRRAWLFADSPKGATANAVLYTLVESARANELDVYEYLNYLLTEIPNSDYLQQPEVLEKYLPWSQELPEVCRLNHNYKKCLK
jgi:Transposase and inactivated derivatives